MLAQELQSIVLESLSSHLVGEASAVKARWRMYAYMVSDLELECEIEKAVDNAVATYIITDLSVE